ncbi:anti-anti-sigma factor [Actinomadura namibiensis]|uniref:Anti-anti-sigma factor n=2 Tax=Actinomadura TaxID=1988 RepID=A0A7W3QN16_ACTNM|nr:anti-anti-sigma factor [Actinomadura namibiensis]
MTTGPVLEEQLGQAAELARAAVLVDLAAVEFLDAGGLRVLVRWHLALTRQGVPLVLCGATGRATRAMQITGLDQVLYVRPDIEQAMHWLDHG